MPRTPNVKCENCKKGLYRRPWQLKKGLTFISCRDCLSKVKKKYPQLYKKIASFDYGNRFHKGDKHTFEQRLNNSLRNGGTVDGFLNRLNRKNKEIRKLREYDDWRITVLQRDNFTCKLCGKRGGKLEADHIKSFSKYPDLRFEINNGRTLCKNCHYLVTFPQKTIERSILNA